VFSMMAVAITLLFAPKGIAGLKESRIFRRTSSKAGGGGE